MEFQIVSWDSFDDEEMNMFTIHFFGRTLGGKSVHVSTHFKPYYFVKGRLPNKPIVKSKDLWGFQGGQECIFTKIECDTLAEFRMSQKKYQGRLYEGNLDPMLRFMHRSGIKSTGWVRVPGGAVTDSSSTCDLDFRVDDWKTLEAIDRDDLMAPFRVCSLDIECYSSTGQFPSSLVKEDVCFQIAITTKEFGHEEFLDRKCFGVKTGYATEREMLEAFVDHFTKLDPDIVTGWNVFGFDFEYIFNRLAICGCSNRVLGRLLSMDSELINKKLSSSALGNNDLKILRMNGRYTFDMYQEIKREHKFESYSLNNVSKILLGDKKNDMPVHEIFSRFRTGQGLEEVEEYCIKDTELPHSISEKLSLIQNLFEMAKACWVPLSFLSERGQQIKVFSQMAQMARELGFMIPTLKREGSAEKYQGATVLEAQTGAYWCPITALDFASLYPSIMCAHNLCYSTYVFDKKYLGLPGVTYETFGPHTFATQVNGKPTPSLLPIILEKLKVYRKEAKKMMKQVPERYAVYNGKQLAYKISMNSVYGFTGASNGILPLVAIAETVTMRGRQMIEESKNYVEKHFPGSNVRYGDTDSIMVEFDVEGRTGIEAIEYSWKLGERASKEISELFKAPNKLELEKVYCPYFLYSKKRYAAKMWIQDDDGKMVFDHVDIKGLQVVRRDSCPFVRRICQEVLNTSLDSSDPSGAIKIARKAKEDLLAGLIPMDDLVLTKSLSGDYKVQMPHVEVVKKMKERNPGSEPQVGSRVPFVILKNNSTRLFDKAEDPGWVNEKNLKLDYQYYFEHQLEKPIRDLMQPIIGSDRDLFSKVRNQKITSFFIKKMDPDINNDI